MVTRKAILISSPGNDRDDKTGTLIDSRRLYQFLTSDWGGAWEDNEIICLSNPTETELIVTLRMSSCCDYVLINFSGHGLVNHNDLVSEVYLDGTKQISVREINPGNKRQLVIVDACREITHHDSDIQKRSVTFGEASRQTNRYKCRTLYDECIMRAGEGRVAVYSCGIGQTAGGNPRDGGIFSKYLVESAKSCCEFSSNIRGNFTYTVKDIFDSATKKTYAHDGIQKPDMDAGRRIYHFPFAVTGS